MTFRAAMHSSPPVAIVGIGCRYPGGVADARAFWQLLTEGRDAIGEIPRDRFDLDRFYDARPATPGRVMTRWGGFLDNLDRFDAAFFGISPREAERMDPAQRLVLETAWEGLEDAGLDIAALDGSATGVFIGQWLSDFEARLFDDPEQADFYMTTGSGRYATSGRLSYLLGLRGPSLTLDTACSSSLVAVHAALRSLRSGECQLALAGGVNVILQPHISVAYSQSRMMAPDGRCKFGDAQGDGYVRSEGAALVVLKPMARALADGDRIYAVLRGSAVNNDGRSSGSMGTPSRAGQEALLRSAYADAGVAAADVSCIEAHGTGTRAGDPVELGALAAVLGEGRAGAARARVGSVKTNFGHTEGAAGVAGLIKLALALHHGRIPASLHCREPNPAIDWAHAPLELARREDAWPPGPRLAGVSAFGIAGTNAHVVLEGASSGAAADAAPVTLPDRPALLLLSARSREALVALARTYAQQLHGADRPRLDDLCWAAATRRTALSHRAAFAAADAATMVSRLEAFATGEAADAEGVVHVAPARGPVFVVPGQGGQWAGMARQLLDAEPAFRDALAACDAAARPWLHISIVDYLRSTPAGPERIDEVQPVLLAVAIACARWLESVGVAPSALIGHSMGEVGAAHLAGALDLAQAMRIICRRSALMSRESGRGAMAMVELPMDDAGRRLAGLEDLLSVAVSNSPRSCVISGDPVALRGLLDRLESEGVFCRPIKVDVASHSPQMDAASAALSAELADLQPQPPQRELLSTVLARPVQGAELDGGYWGRNLRQPVRFTDCVQQALDGAAGSFIELGLHPVLVAAVEQTAQSRSHRIAAMCCGRRDETESVRLMAVLAGLWVAGHALDLQRVLPAARRWVDLPHYPWQRERHWIRLADPLEQRRRRGAAPVAVPAEQQGWLHALRWVPAEAPAAAPDAGPWWVTGEAADSLAAAWNSAGHTARAIAADMLEATLRDGPSPSVLVCLPGDDADAGWLPVATLQAVARSGRLDGSLRLWVVTRGAQVRGGRVAVRAAAAWGSGRVLADEHPDSWGGLVDIDPQATPDQAAVALAGEFGTPGQAQVLWDRGERFELRLRALIDGEFEPAPLPWRKDASYLLTGGLGAVGLKVAASMVAQGARRLLLLGRHGLPPRSRWLDADLAPRDRQRIAAVRALEAAGAAVQVVEADVANAASLEGALQRHDAEAWPPIRGVVHAAGVLDNRLALALDRDSHDRVGAAKLTGALQLDRLLPELDFFVLFSSVSAVLGFSGMANYAAANAGLDALAADRRARGQAALSLQWGPWEGTGMHGGDNAAQEMEVLRRRGVRSFGADQGAALFAALAGRAEATVMAVPIHWPTRRAAGHGGSRGLFAGRGELGETIAGAGLAQRLEALSPDDRRRLAEPLVREAVGAVLKLAPARIDPAQPFGTLGLSSLLAMELRNRLETLFARPLSATLAWNYPTVDSLVGFLCGDSPAAVRPAAASKPAAISADVGRLSDAEALQLLRRRR
ncbi:beta-ketoacyl synthase N-terminal-like domain-containing protein [Variovorax sp. YR752]|uniref:type I polyketide synthase n=1 Tax=Variovorax sp. YR752 TaxID=1884383 RepID=UPI003137E651